MSKVRVAVVGLGDFGRLHVDILSRLPGVELVALVSRSEARARELADIYHVKNTFTNQEEMFAKLQIDAVHVVNEDNRHLVPTMTALQNGAHVFVEKPLSHDLNEAVQMIAEAKRLNRKFMVGHVLRFDSRCAAVKDKIQKGELGKVVTVYGRRNMCKDFLDVYRFANRLFTTGVHEIDLILWYFEGRQPVEVYMKTMNVFGKGDDVFWGMITMEDGSLGVIETNWTLPSATPWRGHILLEVNGTKGCALAEVPGNGLSFWTDSQVLIPDTSYWPSVHGAVVGALRDEIAYFINCLLNDRPVEIPKTEDVLIGLRVAHALIQSASGNRPVRLE